MSQAIKDFDLNCFLKAAEELLRADETIRALNLLDNLPAYYRQNIPPEVQALKREIMSRIATASFYATSSDYELSAPEDSHIYAANTLRGQLLLHDIKALNSRDLMPHLLDLAPGEYAFVRMLQHNQCLFSYQASYVNHPSYQHYKKHFEERELDYLRQDNNIRPTVYFCGEIIEHLWQEEEIRYEMERKIGLADIIHISTPNMAFDYECTDWRSKGDLGHLRTYTPNEFAIKIIKMFPEYHVQILLSQILHARCVLKQNNFSIPFEVTVNG
jgi:hypothetical protein